MKEDANVYFVADVQFVELPERLVPDWVTPGDVVEVQVVNPGHSEPVVEFVVQRVAHPINHYPTSDDTVALMQQVPVNATVIRSPKWEQTDRATYERTRAEQQRRPG